MSQIAGEYRQCSSEIFSGAHPAIKAVNSEGMAGIVRARASPSSKIWNICMAEKVLELHLKPCGSISPTFTPTRWTWKQQHLPGSWRKYLQIFRQSIGDRIGEWHNSVFMKFCIPDRKRILCEIHISNTQLSLLSGTQTTVEQDTKHNRKLVVAERVLLCWRDVVSSVKHPLNFII